MRINFKPLAADFDVEMVWMKYWMQSDIQGNDVLLLVEGDAPFQSNYEWWMGSMSGWNDCACNAFTNLEITACKYLLICASITMLDRIMTITISE